jgi:hypothetical protein
MLQRRLLASEHDVILGAEILASLCDLTPDDASSISLLSAAEGDVCKHLSVGCFGKMSRTVSIVSRPSIAKVKRLSETTETIAPFRDIRLKQRPLTPRVPVEAEEADVYLYGAKRDD